MTERSAILLSALQCQPEATDPVLISTPRTGHQLALRRPDHCRQCSADLAIGTTAWWDPTTRTVTCLSCAASTGPPIPVEPVHPGQPGAGALREYQRRHQAREAHARAKLGCVGGVLAEVIDEPSSTRAWQQGGQGEVRVGRRLERLLDGTGVRLLHDRRVPRHGHADIDHIAVGPAGVTVIDTKTHAGKIRKDRSGGLFVKRRLILRIDGRDQTKLISGIEKQIGYVKSALVTLPTEVPIDVAGALCFTNVQGLPLLGRIEIREILVDGPKQVARLAARPGSFDPEAIERIWAHLARSFPPA